MYFITACVAGREAVLANQATADILVGEWKGIRERHGWAIGRYVIMPDHVHFFCAPAERPIVSVEKWVSFWKSIAVR